MTTDHLDTFEQPRPVCPHCGRPLSMDDMLEAKGVDLFALATAEGREAITCPSCGDEFWVKGGYTPHYTTAFAEEDL